MRRSKPNRRAALAAMMALLWMLGVEILPNAHLANHEDDHTHDRQGTIVVVTFDSHAHDDGVVHSHSQADEDAHGKPDRRDQLAFDIPLTGHAASGLAHHAAALHSPAPPIVAPAFVPRHAWWIETAFVDRVQTTQTARPTARGPPVA